jgi:hypothetical protein
MTASTKQICILLATALLTAVLLVACGVGGGTTASPPTRAPGHATPSSPPTGGEPTTVPNGETPTPAIAPVATGMPTDDEVADQEYRKLKDGKLSFDPPRQMALGNVEKVRLQLTRDTSVNFATLVPSPEPGRKIITETLKVGTTMVAVLAGDKFKITPLSSEEQLVLSEGINEWEWYVEPLEGGTHSLTLRISVKVKIGDSEKTRDFPVKEIDVQVNVSPLTVVSKFIGDNWDKLLGLLIPGGAIGGWLYQYYRRRRQASIDRSSQKRQSD